MLTRARIITGFIIVLILLAYAAWYSQLGDSFRWSDEKWYFQLARDILSGQATCDVLRRAPGASYYYAMWIALFGESLAVLRLSNLVLMVCASILAFSIAKSIYSDNTTALLAALFCLGYPFFLYMSGFVLSECLTVFFLGLFCWLLILSVRSRTKYIWSLVAVAAGLTCFVRPVLLLTPVVIPFVIRAAGPVPWRTIAVKTTIYTVTLACVIGGWSLHNRILTGSFQLSSHSWHQAYRGAVTPPWASTYDYRLTASEKEVRQKLFDFYRNHFLRAIVYKVAWGLRFWSPFPDHITTQSYADVYLIFSCAILIVLYVMAALGWPSADGKLRLVLLAVVIAYWLFHVAVTIRWRYRMPVDFLLIIFAAGGAKRILSYFGNRSKDCCST